MTKTNKNFSILRDLVTENFILEQNSSLYGCQNGYGHNPFTDSCYPLPNNIGPIAGLGGPKLRKKAPGRAKPAVDKPAAGFSGNEIKALAIAGTDFWGDPAKNFEKCARQYPISSLAGLITGNQAAKFGFIRGSIKMSMLATKATVKATKATGLFGGLAILGTIGYLYSKDDMADSIEAVNYVTKTWNAVKDFLKSEWFDITYEGQVCMGNVFLASYMLSKGGRYIGKMGMSKISKTLEFRKETKSLLGRAAVKQFNKGKPTDATLWIALKQRNLLPEELSSISFNQNGVITIPKGQTIRIPASKLNKKMKNLFKDFIKDGQVVLDTEKAARQLADASGEIINITAKTYWTQAKNSLKNSKILDDLRKVVSIVGKGGTLDRKKLINSYLKETANVLESLVASSKSQIDELYETGLKLKRTEPNIPDAQLKRARELVIRGDNASTIAIDVLKLEGNAAKKMTDYLQLYKRHSELELELAKKFSSVRSFMEQEAYFSKLYGKNINFKNITKSGEGFASQKKITSSLEKLKFESRRFRELVAGTNIGKTFPKYLDALVFFTLPMGALYVGKVLVPLWREELSLPFVYKAAENFFEQKVTDEYMESIKVNPRSVDLNLEKLFNDFADYYESIVKPGPNNDPIKSKELVREFCSKAPKDQDVVKHLDNSLTKEDLKEKFLTLIVGQFKGKEGEVPELEQDAVVQTVDLEENTKTKEVSIMNKKTLKQLVAEVLNENTGQGYGKYPYHAEEYSENEPDQDYMVEWKAIVDEICGGKKKNIDGDPNTFEDSTIEVAKILVKDLDLFRDVLEMAGANKSIGVEVMRQLKDAKERKNLDKELDV